MSGGVLGFIVFYLTNFKEFVDEGFMMSDGWRHFKDCINECIGTMLFCLVISLAAGNNADYAGLGIGAMLMSIVYAGGHVSGGHYNPAVSLGVAIRGKCPWWKAFVYVIVQSAGALAAGGIAYLLTKDNKFKYGFPSFGTSSLKSSYGARYGFGQAFLCETIGTFMLVLTVLHSATCDKKNANNGFYGLSIGFSIVVCAYALGPISGGAFNPAVGLLPVWAWHEPHVASGDITMWIGCYWSAPFVGALLAAVAFWVLNPDEGFLNNPDKVRHAASHGAVKLAQSEVSPLHTPTRSPRETHSNANPGSGVSIELD